MVKTLHSFFKRKETPESGEQLDSRVGYKILEFDRPSKCPRIEGELIGSENVQLHDFDIKDLEYDPGKRPKIWQYHPDKRDEVIRAYLTRGPHKFKFEDGNYPLNKEKRPRRFCGSWFGIFPGWLEYSPHTDVAYCLPCFLFDNPKEHSKVLQQRSQDIVNALHLVSSSKVLIQKLRDEGWTDLLQEVKSFCIKHMIKVPDLNSPYCARRGQPTRDMTLEEYYRVDIFFVTIDKELTELNSRFNENSMELLTLCNSLVPKDGFKSFNIDQILQLVDKFYPIDFSNQEKIILKFQLQHFIIEARNDEQLKHLSTISELCIALAKSEKSKVYFLVDRLVRLILTLPVSTASSERAFSAMKIVKTRLRNRMEDEFLADNLVIYIEKEIAETFDTDSIIEDFKNMKKRRAEF